MPAVERTDRALLGYFFGCGDNEIIKFALMRAHLNRRESEVIRLYFDECLTQEQIAEDLNYSVRAVQNYWYSGAKKLLNIPWVRAYALSLTS